MQTLLVALDGSDNSVNVLDAAVDLARRLRARLVLFRAVSLPVALPAEAFVTVPAALDDILIRDAQNYLSELAERLELPSTTKVGVGTPWRAILDAAREEA